MRQVGVSEPAADHVDLDAGFEQVDGGGMPEGVRADPSAGSGVVEAGGVPADDLVDAVAGERLPAGGEHRGRRARAVAVLGLEQLLERAGGLLPERAGAPFVAFAVQADGRVLAEVEVPGAQVGGLLDAGAGVVEEQDQRAVAQCERAVAGQVGAGGLGSRRVRGTGFLAGRRV